MFRVMKLRKIFRHYCRSYLCSGGKENITERYIDWINSLQQARSDFVKQQIRFSG